MGDDLDDLGIYSIQELKKLSEGNENKPIIQTKINELSS